MKFEVQYKTELKLGTFTKTFTARAEREVVRTGKMLSPVGFVFISKQCICCIKTGTSLRTSMNAGWKSVPSQVKCHRVKLPAASSSHLLYTTGFALPFFL